MSTRLTHGVPFEWFLADRKSDEARRSGNSAAVIAECELLLAHPFFVEHAARQPNPRVVAHYVKLNRDRP